MGLLRRKGHFGSLAVVLILRLGIYQLLQRLLSATQLQVLLRTIERLPRRGRLDELAVVDFAVVIKLVLAVEFPDLGRKVDLAWERHRERDQVVSELSALLRLKSCIERRVNHRFCFVVALRL